MHPTDLQVIGLTCNLVGVFFLANSIILRRARKVVEEFFAVGGGTLDTIKDYSLHKIQVIIGFVFLTAGLLVQGYGALNAAEERGLVLAVCGGVIALAALIYVGASVYSRARFTRLLQESFQRHDWSFTENMELTKEIGLQLGIRQTEDMTVEEFVFRVKKALGVPPNRPEVLPGVAADHVRRARAGS